MDGYYRIDAFSDADVYDRTTYRKPVSTDAQRRHGVVRETIGRAMQDIRDVCPKGRELSLAFTKLEEAMFWSNAAVARMVGSEGGGDEQDPTSEAAEAGTDTGATG